MCTAGCTNGNSDQQGGSLDLLHMGDRPGIASLEGPQDFERGGDDTDRAVMATKEEALGSGANAADLVAV